jgi:hypothetical protein
MFTFLLTPPALACDHAKVADSLGLGLDVGEEARITVASQAFLDQRSQDDLKTHGELECGRGLARQDSGAIQDVLGKDEKDSRLVREHRTSRLGPPGRGASISIAFVI